jgi:hypothetical protein
MDLDTLILIINMDVLFSIYGDLFVLLSEYLSSFPGVPFFFPSAFYVSLLG